MHACVYVCTHVGMLCMCAYTNVQVHMCACECWVSSSMLSTLYTEAWSLTRSWSLLASWVGQVVPGGPCFHLPSAGVTGGCHASLEFTRVLRDSNTACHTCVCWALYPLTHFHRPFLIISFLNGCLAFIHIHIIHWACLSCLPTLPLVPLVPLCSFHFFFHVTNMSIYGFMYL